MVGAVLVEAIDDDPLEQAFFHQRVLPAWHRACRLFATRPLMTCHYTSDEIPDDYWWGYPGQHFTLAADLLYGRSPSAATKGASTRADDSAPHRAKPHADTGRIAWPHLQRTHA